MSEAAKIRLFLEQKKNRFCQCMTRIPVINRFCGCENRPKPWDCLLNVRVSDLSLKPKTLITISTIDMRTRVMSRFSEEMEIDHNSDFGWWAKWSHRPISGAAKTYHKFDNWCKLNPTGTCFPCLTEIDLHIFSGTLLGFINIQLCIWNETPKRLSWEKKTHERWLNLFRSFWQSAKSCSYFISTIR